MSLFKLSLWPAHPPCKISTVAPACRALEMIFSILVILAQVGLEAYILGTLFHYVVKKDAKLEAFRSAVR